MTAKVIYNFFSYLSEKVWSIPTIILILGLGVYFTVKTGFFQFKFSGLILKKTVFGLLSKKNSSKNGLSPFKTLATTLSATLGTGSIAGVATALVAGGPGSIFWMWISAIFGSMTAYMENLLAVYYRERNNKGEPCGGVMYCFKNGFRFKRIASLLSTIFCFCCILASFGIGNAVQTNTISAALGGVCGLSDWVIGVISAVVIFFIIIFGTKGIANVTAILLPIMAIFYFLGTAVIIFANIQLVPKMLTLIVKSAFGFDAMLGGFSGIMIKKAVNLGVRRGIFSNEAGMGSAAIINAAADTNEPVEQGMWGIFEVVFDTIIVCSLTAFALLLSGFFDLETGKILVAADGAELVTLAFKQTLGEAAAWFIVVSTIFFAFASVLGWSFYGIRCIEYLFGEKYILHYKIIFSAFSYFGAVSNLDFIWVVSDVFNGIMMFPNLICLMALAPIGFKITENYILRIKGKNAILPILSFKQDMKT